MKIREIFNTKDGDIWFISDLHYNHFNVINFDKRPFPDIPTMNKYIEEELVKKIKPSDIVFDLGDMFWKCDLGVIKNTLSLINPKRFYKIIGNHDKESVYYKDPVISDFFDEVGDLFEVGIQHKERTYQIFMQHYPVISWNAKPRGSFMLHGHTHGNIDEFNSNSPDLRVDVGFYGSLAKKVGSFVINFKDVLEFMKEKAGTDNFKKYTLDNCKEL